MLHRDSYCAHPAAAAAVVPPEDLEWGVPHTRTAGTAPEEEDGQHSLLVEDTALGAVGTAAGHSHTAGVEVPAVVGSLAFVHLRQN